MIDDLALPNNPNTLNLLHDAVIGRQDLLEEWGFDYVMIAFGLGRGNPEKDVLVMGFSLEDWPKWGTSRQPEDPTLGLVTSQARAEILSVST